LECLWERDSSFVWLSNFCGIDHGKLGFHTRKMKGLIEKDVETNFFRLTREGKMYYEWFVRAGQYFKRQRLDSEISTLHNPMKCIESLGLTDHASLFYNDATEKQDVCFRFLKLGLIRGLAVIYLTSEREMDREKKEMEKYGLDVQELEENGSFTYMSAEDWYLYRGNSSVNKIIDNWMQLKDQKRRKNYAGIQTASNMNVFIDNLKESEVFAYEKRLGQRLSFEVCRLCMYDAPKLRPEQITFLCGTHGHNIVNGIADSTGSWEELNDSKNHVEVPNSIEELPFKVYVATGMRKFAPIDIRRCPYCARTRTLKLVDKQSETKENSVLVKYTVSCTGCNGIFRINVHNFYELGEDFKRRSISVLQMLDDKNERVGRIATF